MAVEDIVLGLLLVIVPVIILFAGLGLTHFMPLKRRAISIILVVVGGLGTIFYGIGFIVTMARDSLAGSIGLGLMVAVELATLLAGIINVRKKPSKNPPLQATT